MASTPGKTYQIPSTNYNYNTLDQLTSATGVGAASYRYDGRGNLLVITSGLNITNYSYDYANRLTQAVLPAGGGTYTYAYDADGRRVSQTSSGSTTSYLWDEQGYGNVALEVSGANITNYLLGEGNLLSQNRAGTLSDYLPDGNGNIRALTGRSGSISDQYGYDAYGNTTHLPGGTNLNPYQYKGQQYDPATALYNLRARYYTPSSGRFLSRDTASLNYRNPVEINRYGYTADDPINSYDPSGHDTYEYTENISRQAVKDQAGLYALGNELAAVEQGAVDAGDAKDLIVLIERAGYSNSQVTIAVTHAELEGVETEIVGLNGTAPNEVREFLRDLITRNGGKLIEGGGPKEHAEQLVYRFAQNLKNFRDIGVSHFHGPCGECEVFFQTWRKDIYWYAKYIVGALP